MSTFASIPSQHELMQIRLNNHILHAGHGDLEQIRVGGIGEVGVDFLLAVAIQTPKFLIEELRGRFLIRGIVRVFGEISWDGTAGQLILEQIDLVEKQDDGRPDKPLRVGDGFEQHQRFTHLVLADRQQGVITSSDHSFHIRHLYLRPDIDRNR